MEIYSTEEQQIEAIKNWWLKNGKYFILAVILTIAALFATTLYKKNTIAKMEALSNHYQTLTTALETDLKKNRADAESFIHSNPESAYSGLLALQLAKQDVSLINYDSAIKTLNEVVSTSKDINLKSIALFRIARIQIQQNDLANALTTLNKLSSKNWQTAAEELKGDIYRAQGDVEKARTAYQAAQEENRSYLLQLKLNDLG